MTVAQALSLESELRATRDAFPALCEPLSAEDVNLQAAAFASPPKWHLAHTTWFFETFLLKPFLRDYRPRDPRYEVLFNSYYNGIGEQHPRDRRGLLSRPGLADVLAWRTAVDAALLDLLAQRSHPQREEIAARIRLGIEHERQHQELFYTDIKYSLSANPLFPVYRDAPSADAAAAKAPPTWTTHGGGLVEIGHGGEGFCFDNELPRHRCFLEPFALADRLVSNAEYQSFIDDDGYRRPELWLSDGWDTVCRGHWRAPLYWVDRDGEGLEFTLHGLRPRQPAAPVCHVSGYEADAYARWAGARLPTEQEWEAAAGHSATRPPNATGNRLHPVAPTAGGVQQLYGACWQWTHSAYAPYPGFTPADGAIGEYNGKFMCNQWVLRGGSCVTAASQSRPTYRNFFYPADRWQFSGIRLARSESSRETTP